ncbi:MAG: hypothetical protein BWK73_34155 [Thiothrix lacustris]|uniref:LysM domain-containing protein n=1 Tax=Thiothrix lacustris TaxID=525917 RepID=A0A1Y1QGQ6_9GAMM|nr:MAG: hypothetical protein BWK73_34155 [Thiothrix lacustris]
MHRNIKLVTATSLLALSAVACTPNPYYGNTGSAAYNTGNRSTVTAGGGNGSGVPVTHTHCGRTHTHVMPAGTHQHGDGCTATSGAAATTNTSAYNNNYGGNYGTQPQQPATNNYGGGYTALPTTVPYYDYSAGTNTSSTYTAPPANNSYSNNTTGNYNSGTSGSYYDYVAPKASTNTSGYRSTQPAATANNAVSGAGSYTVQKGDTVFQVMRNSGVYWKDIIRLNNLQAPNYPITPGQKLKLK